MTTLNHTASFQFFNLIKKLQHTQFLPVKCSWVLFNVLHSYTEVFGVFLTGSRFTPESPLVPPAKTRGAEEAKNSSLAMFLESAFVRDILASQSSRHSTVMFSVHRLTLRQQLETQRNTSTVIAASCGSAQNASALLTASQEEFPRRMYSKTLFSWGQTKWHFVIKQ